MSRLNSGILLLGALSGGVASSAAAADTAYPTKPIRWVVPYVAGGAADIFARTVGAKLTEAFGQTVVVDNRPGANGGIGTELVAKAPPDGYTLLLGNSGPVTVNPVFYDKVPYDPVQDLAPVTQGTSYMYVLVTQPAFAAGSVKDLIALAKARPGVLTYGSTGIGGGNHLAGEMFALMTGARLIHVPYKGSAAALADLLGGQLSVMFDTPITSVPQLRAGKLKALAVTGPKRLPALPEVQTLEELGLKGYEITQWQGMLAPAGTPRSIVDKLHAAAVKALKLPDVIDRLATQGGNELVGNTPEQFARVIKQDLAKYAKLVKDANIKPQ